MVILSLRCIHMFPCGRHAFVSIRQKKRFVKINHTFLEKKQGSFAAPLEFKISHCLAGTLPKTVTYLNIVNDTKYKKINYTLKKDENMNFFVGKITNEERIKGNQSTGFRQIPLTEKLLVSNTAPVIK